MKLFRTLTTVIFICVLVIAALHVVLLVSDSPTYRVWVYVQVGLYGVAGWLLWRVRRFRKGSLFALAVVTVPLTYINAAYLNYGNGLIMWFAPVLFWAFYGALAVHAFRASAQNA